MEVLAGRDARMELTFTPSRGAGQGGKTSELMKADLKFQRGTVAAAAIAEECERQTTD